MSTHQTAIDRQVLADKLLDCGLWRCHDDDDDLCQHAAAQAEHCSRLRWQLPEAEAHRAASRRVQSHHLELPDADSDRGQLARMCCESWWRRQLRRLNARRLEQRQRLLGKVHDRAGIYVSQEGYWRRRAQHVRNAKMLEQATATNQKGQEYTLAELAAVGLANPDNRRGELMLRIRETEEEAKRLGHVCVFVTITCPSRFHAVRKGTGIVNPKWEDAGRPTPRDARDYLQTMWNRANAKLGRLELRRYGIRVAEPHHDGCPHWHLLIWCEPKQKADMLAVLRDYALQDSPEEVMGREDVRFKVEHIDSTKGSAVGYVAKYLSKNINGKQFARENVEGDNLDRYGHELETIAPRIEAWASTWGIRQFQPFGLPDVGVWRELRRLRDVGDLMDWAVEREPSQPAQKLLYDMRNACDAGHWAEFMRLMGGPMVKRDEQPVRPWRIDRLKLGGEIQTGAYGDPLAAPLGVVVLGYECITRHYLWNTGTPGRKSQAARDVQRDKRRAAAWTPRSNGVAKRPLGEAFDIDTGRPVETLWYAPMHSELVGLDLGLGLGVFLRTGGAPRTRVNNSTRPLGAELLTAVREDRAWKKLQQKMPPVPPKRLAQLQEQTAIIELRTAIAFENRSQALAEARRIREGEAMLLRYALEEMTVDQAYRTLTGAPRRVLTA